MSDVVAALNLYAELSGGRYPHVDKLDARKVIPKFDAGACYREMFALAGMKTPTRDDSTGEPTSRQIQQVRPGLDTLERVFHNPKWSVGYYGEQVRPQDEDRVLLWWNVARSSRGDQYRVFYGDLRTEVVSEQRWQELVGTVSIP